MKQEAQVHRIASNKPNEREGILLCNNDKLYVYEHNDHWGYPQQHLPLS